MIWLARCTLSLDKKVDKEHLRYNAQIEQRGLNLWQWYGVAKRVCCTDEIGLQICKWGWKCMCVSHCVNKDAINVHCPFYRVATFGDLFHCKLLGGFWCYSGWHHL